MLHLQQLNPQNRKIAVADAAASAVAAVGVRAASLAAIAVVTDEAILMAVLLYVLFVTLPSMLHAYL